MLVTGVKNYLGNNKLKMSKEKYFEMCEMMGKEPNMDLIPIDFHDFPIFIQQVFQVHNILTDRWDSMSGAYLGKDLTLVPYLFELYDITDHKNTLYFLNVIVAENARVHNDKVKQETKAASKRKK